MSIFRRISTEEIFAGAYSVWNDKNAADKIAQDTIEIINKTYKRRFAFYNGRKSASLVGGLFYLLGYRFNNIKKQRELASGLGVSDVTIRASYRQWLREFPDLFLDVIAKFARDKELQYFVLLNLRQELQNKKAGILFVSGKTGV